MTECLFFTDELLMKNGFTLLQMLIVVLIIGILAAVALPKYQLAVDQSRWSTMLPGSKALKDAQERMWMLTSSYTNLADSLDTAVPGTRDGNEIFSGAITYTLFNAQHACLVSARHSNLPGVALDMYLSGSKNFPNETHCEALASSDRANRLCEQIGQGMILGQQGDYNVYVVDGSGHGVLEP